jgi:hypothetical protein
MGGFGPKPVGGHATKIAKVPGRSLSGEVEWILMQVRSGNLEDLRKLADRK